MMNYKPNTINWKVGATVIHDCDAKRKDLLAKIVETKETKQGKRYRMMYFDMAKNYEEWWNTKEVLHDPDRFGL